MNLLSLAWGEGENIRWRSSKTENWRLSKGKGKREGEKKEISCRVSVQSLVWVAACVLKKPRNAFLRYDQEVRLRQARRSAEAPGFFVSLRIFAKSQRNRQHHWQSEMNVHLKLWPPRKKIQEMPPMLIVFI